ncbi:HlyD family membrane protein [Rahnella aquatilis CIP 78.65 = ATCC 33071]|uniref:Multidrug resistance efflux pump n=1 Tax=Rahnella aquatilis (strain ATCC 33071 / DSM 4594 / JCM 1683 / NBRC 105701 / NCIMB 13365 / CIP 78.65) TaxID=745277 RepID=H2IVK0_RAHAC|nr:HlyD family secretion protein [Rahnella aquatilis]AEX51787.1 multidrug resistance efflux pump [Rahnella aquatilis CIP 78.65 = ATCC 33071]KFD15936.1 HlyD family membrane protein [Rahnella aquatilis CIP 78.65 = ATCC 33071]
MKPFFSLLARYMFTLSAVMAAAVIAFMMWKHYAQTPWTRDGRVRADVVQITPDVSGPVSRVAVRDNQWVNRGDVLYSIDPQWLKLAVISAQAEVDAKRNEMQMRQDAARRRSQISGVISKEDIQNTNSAAGVAAAEYQGALAALELAKLNLSRATIHSPADGYVTHLRLRPGDYASAGITKVAIIDASSFWIVGYFEETKMQHIHVGSAAKIVLMGYEPTLTGHVESIGRGIDDSNDAPGSQGLPDVESTFSWVRLAQRVPVRIHIDQLPEGVELVAGMTASVAINASKRAEVKADHKALLLSGR